MFSPLSSSKIVVGLLCYIYVQNFYHHDHVDIVHLSQSVTVVASCLTPVFYFLGVNVFYLLSCL